MSFASPVYQVWKVLAQRMRISLLSALTLAAMVPVAAQEDLPPEILIDRHLLRGERLLADGDRPGARAALGRILDLEREHSLDLAAESRLAIGELALEAGMPAVALELATDYLRLRGRGGQYYREALEVLDVAEEAVRAADAERRRVQAAHQRAERQRQRLEAAHQENADHARRQREAAAVPVPRDSLRSGGYAPEVVTVLPGRYRVLRDWQRGVRPIEWVAIREPFAIGKYEVTVEEFKLFVDRARYRTDARREYGCGATTTPVTRRNSGLRWDRPGYRQNDRYPVTCVSYRDAVAYTAWLSEETGRQYRLPTREEWRYAWRAGGPTAMLLGPEDALGDRLRTRREIAREVADDTLIFGDRCRHEHSPGCTDDLTSPREVGSLASTGIGLYDMAGNVLEILQCSECRQYTNRIGRGWVRPASYVPIDSFTHRETRNNRNWLGFRVVRVP